MTSTFLHKFSFKAEFSLPSLVRILGDILSFPTDIPSTRTFIPTLVKLSSLFCDSFDMPLFPTHQLS